LRDREGSLRDPLPVPLRRGVDVFVPPLAGVPEGRLPAAPADTAGADGAGRPVPPPTCRLTVEAPRLGAMGRCPAALDLFCLEVL